MTGAVAGAVKSYVDHKVFGDGNKNNGNNGNNTSSNNNTGYTGSKSETTANNETKK